MTTVGVDIGSLTTKVVLLNESGILTSSISPSQEQLEEGAKEAVDTLLRDTRLTGNNVHILSTGLGGKSITFSQQQKAITTCLARGVNYLVPSARMAIEIGAESSTVIKLNERGRVSDWVNHDKCAAGTGMFLQQMAKIMQVPLDEMSELSYRANNKADITGTCAVFAESEVISHVHRVPPTPKEDIVAGIYASVVSRIIGLCKRVGITKDVAVVGGVALNRGLVKMLENELGFGVIVPDSPQLVAALGAAVLAGEKMDTGARA